MAFTLQLYGLYQDINTRIVRKDRNSRISNVRSSTIYKKILIYMYINEMI